MNWTITAILSIIAAWTKIIFDVVKYIIERKDIRFNRRLDRYEAYLEEIKKKNFEFEINFDKNTFLAAGLLIPRTKGNAKENERAYRKFWDARFEQNELLRKYNDEVVHLVNTVLFIGASQQMFKNIKKMSKIGYDLKVYRKEYLLFLSKCRQNPNRKEGYALFEKENMKYYERELELINRRTNLFWDIIEEMNKEIDKGYRI